MEYNTFENQFLNELKNKNEKCLTTIETNEKIVQLYLQNTKQPIHINNVINNINDIILNEKEDFSLIKKVLYHPLMKDVLEKFRESDVFIKAIKEENTEAQNWLVGMGIKHIMDENGKTVPMYLLEQGNFETFNEFIGKNKENIDINYRNKETNECIVSIFIKKYKEIFTQESSHLLLIKSGIKNIKQLARALSLVMTYPGCDFNISIDEKGNTPLMFFLMMEDYPTVSFIVSQYPEIDLSKKNVDGINASFLSLFIKNEHHLLNTIIDNKTFDHQYLDECKNNLLIYSVLTKNSLAFTKLISENEKAIDHLNDNQENALIIATKLGFLENLSSYSLRKANFNQKDSLGNTALYYAIKLKDEYAINLLAYYGSDPNIKNNKGVSALDLANEMGVKSILKILKKPVQIHKMKSKSKEKSQKSSIFKGKGSKENLENCYQKDYEDFIDSIDRKINTYTNKNRLVGIEESLALTYYLSLKYKDNYIPLNYCDARCLVDEGNAAAATAFAVAF
jgi:ankyrin repeat protein